MKTRVFLSYIDLYFQCSPLHKACHHFGPNEGQDKRRPHLWVSPQVWLLCTPWVNERTAALHWKHQTCLQYQQKIYIFINKNVPIHPLQIRLVPGERPRWTARTTTLWPRESKWRKTFRIINSSRLDSSTRTSMGRASCPSERWLRG